MKRGAALLACLGVVAGLLAGSSSAVVSNFKLVLSESSPYESTSDSTLYYAPTGTNSGSFTVTATAATTSTIDSVAFPSVFGSDDLDDDTSPYAQTYSWTASATASGSKTVTVTDTDAPTPDTDTATFTVTPDKTGPTGQKVALSGGPGYAALSVPLLFENGSDAGAGVDDSSGVVERASATLSNGSCGTFGTFSTVTLSSSADTTVQSGNCYRYQYKVADEVGNLSTSSTPSGDAQVDATPPTVPALSFSGLTNAAVSGSVIYLRPSGGGTFTITATAADPESGIASYSFPTLAGFTSLGSGPSRTFTFASSPTIPAGPLAVTATNKTGLASTGGTFTLASDSTAPTVAIRCNGKPCHASPYPKAVTVSVVATDTGGSGVSTVRYTFDGSIPTTDRGADYEGPFVVKARTRIKVRAYDKVGNEGAIATATIQSLADRLVFVAPAQLSLKVGARYLLARVTSSHHAIATATLSGPKLKQPRRWRFVLGSGASIVQFKLPTLTTPGRYTIVWTVRAGDRKATRTTRVVLHARPKKS